jgi:hypothetical protein
MRGFEYDGISKTSFDASTEITDEQAIHSSMFAFGTIYAVEDAFDAPFRITEAIRVELG